jgi:hypothetical protein
MGTSLDHSRVIHVPESEIISGYLLVCGPKVRTL